MSTRYADSGKKEATSTRVTITIDGTIYENIKRASKKMGISPSTWITMMCTSKINDLELLVTSKSKGG